MSTSPNLSNEPEVLKIKSEDDQSKELQYKTEKHDLEIKLKSLKTDKNFYKKKFASLNKKKVLFVITEILIGSGSALLVVQRWV